MTIINNQCSIHEKHLLNSMNLEVGDGIYD